MSLSVSVVICKMQLIIPTQDSGGCRRGWGGRKCMQNAFSLETWHRGVVVNEGVITTRMTEKGQPIPFSRIPVPLVALISPLPLAT